MSTEIKQNLENNDQQVEQSTETIVSETKTAPAKRSFSSNNQGFNNKKPGFGGMRRTRSRVSASGFEEKVVEIKRISKTTKGGRRMRFSALVVIGDKNGKVGFGIGKSGEVPNAIKKAIKNARNSVQKVIMNKNNTLYHEVIGYESASKVLIKPAKPGTGIIAGGAIRAVIEHAGYKDVYTKNLGSNTALNMVQATINGLSSQKHPSLIAKLRDKDIKEL